MDMTGFKFGKPEPRIYRQKAQKQDAAAQERLCRALVKRRDHGKCIVPGCKETYAHLHHIVFRSQSKAKRWLTSNCCLLCTAHHQLLHAGLITITGNADEHLTIVGDKRDLAFKL